MMAQLVFVRSLFTSKIFLAQVVTLVAMVMSAAGYHLIDAPGAQEQLIGVLDVIVTTLFRWLAPTGPVSLSGPVNAPATRILEPGTQVIHVEGETK